MKVLPTYKTIWRRFCSSVVDAFVLAPLFIFVLLASFWKLSGPVIVLMEASQIILTCVYQVSLLTVWGQTLGMKALGVRLVDIRGGKITFPQVLLKLSVSTGLAIALFSLKAPQLWNGTAILHVNNSRFAQQLNICSFIWIAALVVSILLSSKRRSLADRMAGSVVIRLFPAQFESDEILPEPEPGPATAADIS